MSEKKKKKLALIASKGTLDMAYPPMILATAAAALDWDVGIFFTFYGLNLLDKKKHKKLKVGSVGNPAQPLPVPNLFGMLPGSTGLATKIMKRWMKGANVAPLPDLIDVAFESDVRMFGCQMTMDVMGYKKDDFFDGVEYCGAAAFLDYASDADVTLFI